MRGLTWQTLALVLAAAVAGWIVGSRSAGTAGDHEVVAVVGGQELTLDDVKQSAPQGFLELARREFELTDANLERAIQIKLIEIEADREGMTPAELVQREVDDRVEEATDADIAAFYEERRLQGRGSVEALEGQIRDYMSGRARTELYAAFLDSLGDKYPVEVFLQPPRIEVADEGFPSRGPSDAPVTIVEFADFQCPYCGQMVRTLDQLERVFGEQVRLVYRQFPIPSIHPYAQKAAEASLCADEQGKFWEMHDAMYGNQRALDVDALKRTAFAIGLEPTQFAECLDSGKFAEAVGVDVEAGSAIGVTGTPAFFVNGRYRSGIQEFEALAQLIDDELERAGVDFERQPLRTEVVAEGPAKGPQDAPITMIEFSDFQCPFCAGMLGALEQVMETYGDQVRFVYRQFPLVSIHPQAQKAAEASLCANEQGKFWEMHDAMFADQDALEVPDLKRTAADLGLDRAAFDECLDGDLYAQRVAADVSAARRAGVTGTPALFINGRFLSGIHEFDEIAEVIEDELRRISQSN